MRRMRFLGQVEYEIHREPTDQHRRFEELRALVREPLDIFKLTPADQHFLRNFFSDPPKQRITRQAKLDPERDGMPFRIFPKAENGQYITYRTRGNICFSPIGGTNPYGDPEYICSTVDDEYAPVLLEDRSPCGQYPIFELAEDEPRRIRKKKDG